jgi:TolA-binding protein
LKRFRSGARMELPREPVYPVLDHEKSMRRYRAAIAADSASLFGGAALYSLAWCYNDLARFDSAFTCMSTLATRYPDHPHAAQAWMFCGEYQFDKGDLKNALSAFYTVMKYPESEWFDEALYKVAWTQYRLSNPEKAISSFLALVDLGGGRFGHSLLEKESMDYIAISFSETDISGEKGLDRAAAFARRLGDAQRGCQILHRLAQVYRDQGRHAMAKKTFEHILSSYPNFTENPAVEAELIAVIERDASTELSIDQKYDYFKKYCRRSAWAQRQPDTVRAKADSTACSMLYTAAISFHQLALQKNNDSLYRKAIGAYTDYIDLYPATAQANECHYNLAEIQFSLGNYRQAAEEYIAVSRRYPDSKYRETAAWNAIVASQNLLKLEKTPVR